MRDDGDFAAYLVARWAPVVRTLVMLGSPRPVSEDVARSAFARLSRAWTSIRDLDDIDAHVYATVLRERRHHRTGPVDAGHRDQPVAATLARLEARLDRLTPDVRAVLVLRFVAGLDDDQVAEVLGRPVATSEALAEEIFREASESIEVPPPSLEDVRRRAGEQRRRSWSRAGRWSLAAVLLVGLTTWVATRSEPERVPELTVAPTTRVENPVHQAWFANGELHLDHVVVELPALRDLVAVSGGAVYAADDGVVVFVADDGARTRLGTKEPGTPLVASDEQGWVSWSDTGSREPVLVLYDLTSRQRLRTITPERGSATPLRPVAIDQDRLYFASENDSFSVTPDGEPQLIDGELLDVSSATRAFQDDPESLRMEQSFFSTVTTAPGVGAQLSPDGTHVLTRTADDVSSYGTVRLYDTRSGDELVTGLTAEDVAVAAAFAPDGTVTYVVARAEDRPSADRFVRQSFSGALELRTCAIGGIECAVVAKFPSTGSAALLAG